jgi:biopolymer transport protein ExbD
MAQLEFQFEETRKTKRKPHPSLRMDMTPMVDLGFLLITFFIFTTTMSEKNLMKLIMPTEKGDSSPVPASKVLTVLLGDHNKVFAYEGRFEDAVRENRIIPTTYDETDGIGELIREKQKQLKQAKKKNELIFLIKPTSHCTYKNIIDALDEITINEVKKYVIIDPADEEKLFLQKK